MAALRVCKAEVKFQCPNWDRCNEIKYGGYTAGKNTCRFCVTKGRQTMCLLHNKHLTTNNDGTVNKCKECLGKTTGIFGPKLTQVTLDSSVEMPPPNVKDIVKTTADNMQKVLKQLLEEGYPQDMAIKATHDLIVKGGW